MKLKWKRDETGWVASLGKGRIAYVVPGSFIACYFWSVGPGDLEERRTATGHEPTLEGAQRAVEAFVAGPAAEPARYETVSDILADRDNLRRELDSLVKASDKFWRYVNQYSDPLEEHDAVEGFKHARKNARKAVKVKARKVDE